MTTTPIQPKTTPYTDRQEKLITILEANGFSSLILNACPSLTYLTGLHFHLSERPVLAFFMPDRNPLIFLPELELEKLKNLPFLIESFPYGEDPKQWNVEFLHAIKTVKLGGKSNGVESRQLRYLEFQLLLNAATTADFFSADDLVSKLRMYKEEIELVAMRKAAEIAENALTATIPFINIGISEREIASELTLQLFRAGSDPQLAFSPIVSSGPNSANPHSTPSDRILTSGDLLVIDWGACSLGYNSDITRTFGIGNIEPEFSLIGKIVLEANTTGRKSAKPGITAEMVDKATRDVIVSAGYGKYFTHRTGHGLGMEGHEEPYIRANNPMLLEPGMTFTIEPGIYLPGRNGVRIEDDVVITDTGAECLTSFPRKVIQLV
jgi:Xaa-Pro dipeptidase